MEFEVNRILARRSGKVIGDLDFIELLMVKEANDLIRDKNEARVDGGFSLKMKCEGIEAQMARILAGQTDSRSVGSFLLHAARDFAATAVPQPLLPCFQQI
ncbi:hypothetical protein Leryth_007928 [Lithospermum erythrorhizon]|nr:hypothetical protein Leryth_007928 [Lithospermum erythrorhizon]